MESITNFAAGVAADAPSTAPTEPTKGVDKSVESGDNTSTGEVSAPKESFKDWVKKKDAEKGKPKSDVTPADAKLLPDTEEKVDEIVEGDETAETEEPAPEPSIKIGDKEYKAQDIADLTKSFDEHKATHESYKKQVDEFVDILKKDPGQVLEKLLESKETEDAFMDYLTKRYVDPLKFKAMSPEDKVKHYEQQEVERKAQEKADLEAKSKSEQENRIGQERARLESVFKGALKEANIPESQWTMSRMASYAAQARERGLQHVTAQQLTDLVKEDLAAAQASTLSSMDPEELAKALGEETLSKLRARDVAKYKTDKFKNENPSQGRVKRPEPGPKKVYKNTRQLLDDL